ncbi:MAG: fumarylacetoacetate hydrolase family protein [Acidobacteria bacterium]|nr:fumarylacetoacetate hydrolase family protein [Acidobacteriota bacterium]MBI3426260.1 fumarylacetoacetate hydrolase family protein [Acidobacteriota bacterium]
MAKPQKLACVFWLRLSLRLVAISILCTVISQTLLAQRHPVSDQPETPFKLAAFEVAGKTHLGLVLGEYALDIAAANAQLAKQAKLPNVAIPAEMRELIEQYARLAPRLYQLANFYQNAKLDGLAFAHSLDKIALKAPIKYPWNLLAAAVNYKSHAAEMGGTHTVNVEAEDPIFFAKSPRNCIIDPGAPFLLPPGRNIDWEGELAIVMGKPAFNLTLEQAHDYVFGYSIVFDVSDRGGAGRKLNATIPGPNWFNMKSREGAAPFGPFIVPKEFMPNHANLRIVTKVNGVVKQDGNTKNLIFDEAHIVRYLSSVLTLYPGDVIVTGTPEGVGAARKPPEFLKPGDEVAIEIKGIGILKTPLRAAQK